MCRSLQCKLPIHFSSMALCIACICFYDFTACSHAREKKIEQDQELSSTSEAPRGLKSSCRILSMPS